MTAASDESATAVSDACPSSKRRLTLPWLVALSTLLTLAVDFPLIPAVRGGGFVDPDDAMRLVEVRAWMAGQPWFDVAAARLDPPLGASMHWSRLVDVPNALLIRVFGLVTPHAEAWDRIVLPTLLLAGLYAGVARLAAVLLGCQSQVAALIGLFLSGATLVVFQPGRIGHHGPETVALVWAVVLALSSLEGRAWQAAGAGALVALSLAMSLETLPFHGALIAAMFAVWIARGPAMTRPLLGFSLGLGAALPCLFLATVDPQAWLAPVCDALGAAHLGAAMIVATGGVALAVATRGLATWPRRLAAAALVATLVGAYVATAYPGCLHSPFAGVDPLVREIWLDHVQESLPLLVLARGQPALAMALTVPTALGAACALWAACRLPGIASTRFAIVAGVGAFGLTLGFWQVRVFTSAMPFAVCGGLYAVAAIGRRLHRAGLGLAAMFAPIAILPFTATGWALVLPAGDEASSSRSSCLAAEAVAPLKALPPGRVVAPINSGSYILEATANTVFSAPYHRNNDGNRFAMDVFLSKPSQAHALLDARHVTYVMTCPGLDDVARLAARAPDGLAAQLAVGAVPAFLHRVPLAGTPYRVYAVVATPP